MSDPSALPYDNAATMLGPEGVDPAQPAPVLGAAPGSAADLPCEGAPPFINRRLSIAEWRAYLASYAFGSIAPTRLVLHHTWSPNEAQWHGLASMRGMQAYYAGMGWTSGPHLYAGPDGIWLATPMSRVGIHAGTANGSVKQGWYSLGLEMVGDFDQARPAGAVWANALAVMAGLSARLRIAPRQLVAFHRDSSPKSCPGKVVTKEWVWAQVETTLIPPPALPTPLQVIGVAPSIRVTTFRAVLSDHGAPFEAGDAMVIADRLYDLCLWLDIDPAFFLALWLHEQGDPLGSSPVGRATLNPLNTKAYGPRWPALTIGAVAWNRYSSLQLGCLHAIVHLKEIHGAAGRLHVETIIPEFAPADDQNNVPGYIASVRRDMAAMRAREAPRA